MLDETQLLDWIQKKIAGGNNLIISARQGWNIELQPEQQLIILSRIEQLKELEEVIIEMMEEQANDNRSEP